MWGTVWTCPPPWLRLHVLQNDGGCSWGWSLDCWSYFGHVGVSLSVGKEQPQEVSRSPAVDTGHWTGPGPPGGSRPCWSPQAQGCRTCLAAMLSFSEITCCRFVLMKLFFFPLLHSPVALRSDRLHPQTATQTRRHGNRNIPTPVRRYFLQCPRRKRKKVVEECRRSAVSRLTWIHPPPQHPPIHSSGTTVVPSVFLTQPRALRKNEEEETDGKAGRNEQRRREKEAGRKKR